MRIADMPKTFVLAVLGAACTLPMSANLVPNGTFSGTPTPPSFQTVFAGQSVIPDWTVVSGSVDWIGTYWQQPTDCPTCNSIDLDGDNVGSVATATTIATTNSQTYHLTFELSGNPDGGPNPKLLNVSAGTLDQNLTYTLTGSNSVSNMNWEKVSLFFTASSSSTSLTFASNDPAPNAYGPVITNVSVTATPEPGFYGLLALGLSGLLLFAARRQTHRIR